LRLAGVLWRFWNIRDYLSEGRGWLSKALGLADALPQPEGDAAQARMSARARALLGSGVLAIAQGDSSEGKRAFQASAALARQVGDKLLLTFALNLLGTVEAYLGAGPIRIDSVEESAALSREIGDQWGLAMALGILSHYARSRGEIEKARYTPRERQALPREEIHGIPAWRCWVSGPAAKQGEIMRRAAI
jgi:hypothetical protein